MTPDDVLAGYLETGAFDEAALAQLTPDEQVAVRAEQAGMDQLRAAFAEEDFWADPADDLEARVLDAVFADGLVDDAAPAATRGAATPGAPATTSGAAAGNVVSLAEARARRSRAVSIGASLVAAAAVVAAVIGFARPTTTATDIAAPTTTSATATTASTVPGRDLVVSGTDLAPGTTGSLRLEETSSGVRILLDMDGLPRRDRGQFYEAWAKTAKGLVPIGTFHTGTDVVLWSGIELADIEAITVTLEENDGNQESSGRRVILAPLRPAAPGTTVAGTTPGPGAPGTTR